MPWQDYFPETTSYSRRESPSLEGFFENLWGQGKDFGEGVGGIYAALKYYGSHPNEIKWDKVPSGAGKILKDIGKGMAETGGFKDGSWSLKNLGEKWYEEPLSSLIDATFFLGGTGGLLSKGGKIAKGLGAAEGLSGGLSKFGGVLSKAGEAVDPLNIFVKQPLKLWEKTNPLGSYTSFKEMLDFAKQAGRNALAEVGWKREVGALPSAKAQTDTLHDLFYAEQMINPKMKSKFMLQLPEEGELTAESIAGQLKNLSHEDSPILMGKHLEGYQNDLAFKGLRNISDKWEKFVIEKGLDPKTAEHAKWIPPTEALGLSSSAENVSKVRDAFKILDLPTPSYIENIMQGLAGGKAGETLKEKFIPMFKQDILKADPIARQKFLKAVTKQMPEYAEELKLKGMPSEKSFHAPDEIPLVRTDLTQDFKFPKGGAKITKKTITAPESYVDDLVNNEAFMEFAEKTRVTPAMQAAIAQKLIDNPEATKLLDELVLNKENLKLADYFSLPLNTKEVPTILLERTGKAISSAINALIKKNAPQDLSKLGEVNDIVGKILNPVETNINVQEVVANQIAKSSKLIQGQAMIQSIIDNPRVRKITTKFGLKDSSEMMVDLKGVQDWWKTALNMRSKEFEADLAKGIDLDEAIANQLTRLEKNADFVKEPALNKLYNEVGEPIIGIKDLNKDMASFYAVPKTLWRKFTQQYMPSSFVQKLFERDTNFWKKGVLVMPSVQEHNLVGNILLAIMAEPNPKWFGKAFEGKWKEAIPEAATAGNIQSLMLKNSGGGILEPTQKAVWKAQDFLGGKKWEAYTKDTLKTAPVALRNLGLEEANKLVKLANVVPATTGAIGKGMDWLLGVNTAVDNYARKVVYLDQAEKYLMKSTAEKTGNLLDDITKLKNNPEAVETIMEKVDDLIYNWAKLSQVERRVIRPLIPFYSFLKFAAKRFITMPITTPKAAFALNKLSDLASEASKDKIEKQYGEGSYENLPSYMKGSFPVGEKNEKGQTFLGGQGENPFNLIASWEGGGILPMLNPAIKIALEQFTGKNLFTGKSFTSPNVKEINGQLFRLNEATGEAEPIRKVTPPLGEHIAQQFPEYALGKKLIMGNTYGTGEENLTLPERNKLLDVARALGLDIREFDVEKQWAILKSNQRRALRALLKRLSMANQET